MTPSKSTGAMAASSTHSLDVGELSYLEKVFVATVEGSDKAGRISIDQAAECLEQMDFEFFGNAKDVIKSVVPASAEADSLDLNDVVKVATSAKSKQAGALSDGLSPTSVLTREDSVMELERSFKSQMAGGGVPSITEESAESPNAVLQGPPVKILPVSPCDTPVSRHRSIDVYDQSSASVSELHQQQQQQQRKESLPGVPDDPANLKGPPKQIDIPQRRTSHSPHPGSTGIVVPPPTVPPAGDNSPLSLTPKELSRQGSEAALLASATLLPAGLVMASTLPVRKPSMAVSDSDFDDISEGSETGARPPRNSQGESDLDFESIGGSPWQCLVCTRNVQDVGHEEEHRDDTFKSSASKIEQGKLSKSTSFMSYGSSISRRLESRAGDGKACSIM